MKASIISSLGLAAAVSAQSGYATSTVYATTVYTTGGAVTTDIISLYTTICPVTATETGSGAPYPTGTPGGVSSGTAINYPTTEAVYPTTRSTSTVYECTTSTEGAAPTYPASSEGVPTYPASSEAAPTYPATSEAAPTYPVSTPSPIVSTATISTCIPTVITTVYTITPTAEATYPATTPVGTAASSGAVYPTSPVVPYTGGAAAKKAGGLLMLAGLAAALL